jgi:hypothetical protein
MRADVEEVRQEVRKRFHLLWRNQRLTSAKKERNGMSVERGRKRKERVQRSRGERRLDTRSAFHFLGENWNVCRSEVASSIKMVDL